MRSPRCWLGLHHFDILQVDPSEVYLRCSEPGCLARSAGWGREVKAADVVRLQEMVRDERKAVAA